MTVLDDILDRLDVLEDAIEGIREQIGYVTDLHKSTVDTLNCIALILEEELDEKHKRNT